MTRKKSSGSGTTDGSQVVSTPELGSLLSGKKVGVANDFLFRPSEDAVKSFVLSQGGKISDIIDESLDYFIADNEETPVIKKVRNANKKGAGIKIVAGSWAPLATLVEKCLPACLDSTKKFNEMVENWKNIYWLSDAKKLVISGQNIVGKKLGKPGHSPLLNGIVVKNSDFEECKLAGFRFEGATNCVFAGCDLAGFGLWSRSQKINFRHCRGKKLNLHYGLSDSLISACEFQQLDGEDEFLGFIKTDISNCKFANFTGRDIEFDKSNLAKTTIANLTARAAKFVKCELADVSFLNGQVADESLNADGGIVFTNCKLANVQFNGINTDYLTFSKCELARCSFVNCSGKQLDFGNSKITKCRIDKCDFPFVLIETPASTQLSGFTSLNAISSARGFSDIETLLKHNRKIAATLGKSEILAIELKGIDANQKQENWDRSLSEHLRTKTCLVDGSARVVLYVRSTLAKRIELEHQHCLPRKYLVCNHLDLVTQFACSCDCN